MSRTAAHRGSAARRGSVFSLLGILKASAMLVAAVILALTAVGGTYATLSSSQAIALVSSSGSTTTTITAGSADLTVSGDALSLKGIYPGVNRTAEFTVGNAGATSLALSVDSVAGGTAANGLIASVARGTCASGGSAITSGALGVTLAPSASTSVCLTVAMPTTAPAAAQSLSSTVTVSITGTQP